MGCNNSAKCVWEADLQDDDSSDAVSVKIVSQVRQPGESTLVPDLALKCEGVSHYGIDWDATKSFSTNLLTSEFSATLMTTINSTNGRTLSDNFSLTEITSQLYLGSFEDAKNEAKVVELGITHILSLIGPKHPIDGIKHKHKPMNDNGYTNLKRLIKEIWSFVMDSQQPGNKLFVHCLSGQNRSATVMISILMKLQGESNKLVDVYNLVKDKRPVVQINELYAKQLLELERDLFGTTTMSNDWMKIRSYNMLTGSVEFCA